MDNKKKLILFGNTPFTRYIEYCIETDGGRVEAYCVSRDYLADAERPSKPIYAFEDLDSLFGSGGFEVLVTVGYSKMNEGRAHIFSECDRLGYSIASYIHSTARIERSSLGRGNIVLSNCVVNFGSHLGDGNILVDYTVIGHESEINDFNFFSGATTGGLAHIDSFCFITVLSGQAPSSQRTPFLLLQQCPQKTELFRQGPTIWHPF